MGLDQYAYARPPRKRNSEDDVQIGNGANTIACKVGCSNLWETKGCPNMPDLTEDELGLVVHLIVLSCNLPKKILMLLKMTFLQ